MALQLLGKSIEPTILRVDAREKLLCSGCRSDWGGGGVAVCPEDGLPYCKKCRKVYARRRIPDDLLPDMARAVASRRRRYMAIDAARKADESA